MIVTRVHHVAGKILVPAVVGICQRRLLLLEMPLALDEFSSFWAMLRSVGSLLLGSPLLFVIGIVDQIVWRLQVVLPARVGALCHDLRENDVRGIFSLRSEEDFVAHRNAFCGDVVVGVEANAINRHGHRADDVEDLSEGVISMIEEQN